MKITYAYVASESKVNENLEKEMAWIMSQMMQLEREVRIGKEAEKKLSELRQRLKVLAKTYYEEE